MTEVAPHQPPPPTKRRSTWQTIVRGLPTALVLLALAAVGYFGHRTGWKAPKFSSLFAGAAVVREDWCVEHSVRESECIACHPELAGESGADWCREHGVPESKCTICHPEILTSGVAGDWCKEHGVPESCCTICHPEIARRGDLPQDDSEMEVGLATEVPAPGPARAGADPATCQKHALKVQFAAKESLAKVGVRLGKAIERPMAEAIVVPAEVGYDRTRLAKVVSRVPGTARMVRKDLGDAVAAGEVLVVVDAAEVGRVKAEWLQAHAASETAAANEQRLERAVAGGFRTEVERIHASAAAREAAIRLFNARQAVLNLGLPLPDGAPTPEAVAQLGVAPELLAAAPELRQSASLLPIRAPLGGVVVARDVVGGEAVDQNRVLYEVADPSRMWITMDVPPALAARVERGAEIRFRPEHARDRAVAGHVDWISTAVDEVTRTLQVRASVDNAGGRLRANSFGTAQIVVRPTATAIAVPNAAVQWEGCCYVVFVRLADTVFQPRKVRIGARDAAFTEVLVGLLPGEVVVTAGSHVLKAEILKSNLGAGCCDVR